MVAFVLFCLMVCIFTFLTYITFSIHIKNKEINLKLSLRLFNKITFFKITNKNKYIKGISKDKNKDRIKGLKLNDFKNILGKIKRKNIKLVIEKFNLNVFLGLENILYTIYANSIMNSMISIILGYFYSKKMVRESVYYKVSPVYNKNYFEVDFEGIFSIKLVHIIYMLSTILNEKRNVKNGRTSNRRAYVYSHE